MIKTKITETTEKFDKEGKLYERVIREEVTEDDETRYPCINNPVITGVPLVTPSPTVVPNKPFAYGVDITCCKGEKGQE